MRRICSFTDFYSVLLDFLRLSGAMILTDYLLLESIQHRIGANKIRVRFTTEFFFEHGFIGFKRILIEVKILSTDILHFPTAVGTEGLFQDLQKNIWGFGQDLQKNIWGFGQDLQKNIWGFGQDLQKNIWGFGQDFGKKHTNQGRT